MSNHQQGVPGMRPGGGSSSNLAGQGVPMVNPAIMAQFGMPGAAGGQARPGQLPMGMPGMPSLNPLQQQQIWLQHQQAFMAQAAAAGRAPSPGGMPTVAIYVRADPSNAASQLMMLPLPPEFVAAKQAVVQQYLGNPGMHHLIKAELDRWNASREASSGAGVTAAQASAAAQLRLQQQLAAKQFPPIIRPQSEDDKQFVPQARLQALVRQVGLGIGIQNAKATEDAEGALRAVAGDFISNAVSFAVAMARRRKSEEIEPADLLLYLERTWGLQVPGFSRGEVKPYQRQPASAEHQRRMAAVRKAMATSAAGSGAGGPAAGTPAGPPAVGAADKQQQQAGGAGGAGPSTAAAATAEDGGAAAAAAAAANGKSGGGATPAKQQQAQQAGKQAGKQAAAAGAEDEDMPDLDAANGKA
ncbi:hypothetical protein COHA_005109 [Chlorella ohadii]|uniref:Transcription initiation factor TFIID subunit 12 domain-containing protein n=1 Tax=Chlorella ohadii TaxID=2649997 RepID=A0AAD5DVJ3_9CHLO|nr:hypothetical protein COHA_005109 [Chlorella ohadii]